MRDNKGRFIKGHKVLKSWKEKSRLINLGNKNHLGLKHSEESKTKISKNRKGLTEKENNPNWKGGKPRRPLQSYDYKIWRNGVFQRDNYTCRNCGKRNCELNAHHIIAWKKSKEKRYDLNNGITLCLCCHNKTKQKEDKFEIKFKKMIKEMI